MSGKKTEGREKLQTNPKVQQLRRSILRPYITLLILATLVIISGFTWGIARLIDETTIDTASTLYVVVLSVVLSGAAMVVMTQWILNPVLRLNRALTRVANGDFSVRLESKHNLNEIRQAYECFNHMVQALSANETLQADFINNVSHEFKTPINAIEGYAMLLQEDALANPEQREYIEKILFNTKRLSDLVGNILLLNKAENQGVTIAKHEFRLDEQIRMAIVALERKWVARDIEPDAELERVSINGNEAFLSHVWLNLIDNAIKFSPEGSTIHMKLTREKGWIRFTVSDCGSGVPEEERERIFEKFYQSESSHAEEGNGLGLPLAKRIVDIHRGTITVENLPGGGACFTVVLPG